jgi:predicted MFS family arabinose efflux permease
LNAISKTRRAGTVLAAGFLVALIGGGARFAIGLTLKPVADEFSWPRGYLGFAVLVYFVVTAVFTFWAGKLVDRISLRLVMGCGIAIAGVGIGLMGFMSQPWQAVLLFGILFGIGNGGASVTTVSVMVTRAMPGRAGLVNSIAISGITVGQLVMIGGLSFVLAAVGWRAVFYWLALVHFIFLLIVLPAIPGGREARAHAAGPVATGMTLREAARTRQFWLLIGIFAICGLDDFLVSTHVVAMAQDRGVDTLIAGNLLAVMGLTGLIGVLIAGVWSDRSGPRGPTIASFALRVAVFALIYVDQSPLSIAIFAIVFGLTFIVTAPLTVIFTRDAFGTRHLGAISGMITMVHQIFGGIGAYAGAVIFDETGQYSVAFIVLLAASVVALLLSLALQRTPTVGAPS